MPGGGVRPAEKALSPSAYVVKAYSTACARKLPAVMRATVRKPHAIDRCIFIDQPYPLAVCLSDSKCISVTLEVRCPGIRADFCLPRRADDRKHNYGAG